MFYPFFFKKKPIIEKPNEIIPEKAPEKTEIIEKKPIENGKSELELKRELLKKKKEDLEKKMAGKVC